MARGAARLASERSAGSKTTLSIHVDGAARGNPGPAGAGALLAGGEGRKRAEVSVYLGEATNNVAEYCALILALQRALRLGCGRVEVFTDSELLAKQMNGEYRVKDKHLQILHVLAGDLRESFEEFSIRHIPREKNRAADRLANRAVSEWLRKHPPAGRTPKPAQPSAPAQSTFF